MAVEIRRGSSRFNERVPGRATWHSFSFGSAYDPDNVSFGPMLCHDDHWLVEGVGFAPHRHSDLVVVSWVLTGALTHTGPTGEHTVGAGSVAVLHTGPGVEHSEVAAAPQTRFVQVWLEPDASPAAPSYDVSPGDPAPGRLSVVSRPTERAAFSVARLESSQSIVLPEAPWQHVFVARGALRRSSLAEPLLAGDAFRITDEPGHQLIAAVPTELLVWGLSGG
ncbi:MAG: pirin family protein [Nocardioides sp.]|nr:pirin family protein [Nocardioides sp.]